MKSKVLRNIIILFALISSLLIFEAVAAGFDVEDYIFSKSGSDLSGTPVEINIVSPQIILQDKEMQMKFETPNTTAHVPVKWLSSNPNVISCTEDGKIKGLIKGSATITVKSLDKKSSDSITVYCAPKFTESETVDVGFFVFWINKNIRFL